MARGFLILISFFTRIPIGNKIEYDEESYVKGLSLYSLMGAVIGLFLAAVYLIFNNVYITLFKGLILTIAYIIITGGIHLDGTADTSDGIFSGRTGERIFEIMSDSHIGSFGVLSLILVVISQIILFSYTDIFTVFMMPVAGRLSVIIASWGKKYAKNSKGMGTLFIESINNNALIINLFIALFFILILPYRLIFLISVIATLMISYFISCKIEDKIGGMTGDTCGFVLEISQIIFMMIILFLKG
ncbi:adenosylcobinamide-GDP ribazoletransferase [Sedimentibacter hydroxybenzoicus DSM 7310]|uniref:Adenosylcobinamide-GDP ribazoletransferase n=1 Tax=Sedimentibacter hydroxybenzoicus DSM 7310 TaxID=1123245 RepID=A0A974GXI3_SEDHY|nr:adenosylcobinamide-GDP ribazoletransferase [Sedimentibacter hydroxybenzoicus]NYB75578.1 adenosylcobinamide-GDP ribazoletransferase [Sedimentibacter hydroxybenzoicus DSM 7310]